MGAMVVTFVLVSVTLTLIPGPDLIFVIRNGAHGRSPPSVQPSGSSRRTSMGSSSGIWG
jgi:hypothetical protein